VEMVVGDGSLALEELLELGGEAEAAWASGVIFGVR